MKLPPNNDPTPITPALSPDAQPRPVHPEAPERSGWPAPDPTSNARRRGTDAATWSPEGPSGEWKRRSLDRFAHFRR